MAAAARLGRSRGGVTAGARNNIRAPPEKEFAAAVADPFTRSGILVPASQFYKIRQARAKLLFALCFVATLACLV